MKENSNKIVGISIENLRKKDILEKIIKNIKQTADFYHIVSLNPEIIVIANNNPEFKEVIRTAHITINDGIGIVLAARLFGIQPGERVTGVDLMKELVKVAGNMRLRVLLIGGGKNLALRLAECYSKQYPEATFKGVEGYENILHPNKTETEALFTIVRSYKPHLVFVAFGSPQQEIWLARHSKEFKGTVGMGVGGAFDFLTGEVTRAPVFLRNFGLEWLFRLITQPWRWRRQVRLIRFAWLVLTQRLSNMFAQSDQSEDKGM